MALRCEHCGERCDNAVGLCDEHMKAEFTRAQLDAAVAAERRMCVLYVQEQAKKARGMKITEPMDVEALLNTTADALISDGRARDSFFRGGKAGA